MGFISNINSLVILTWFLLLFSACKSGSKSTMQKIIDNQLVIKPADSIILKQKKGIDFFAKGNEPANWSIEIDFDKMVYFNSADGISLQILPSFGNKLITPEVEKYYTSTDLGQLEIRIFNTTCNSTGNKAEFLKKTEISLQNKIYTGCGKYLYNHQLNDTWVLESVNNEKQINADYKKGLPWIELDLLNKNMKGSDGCNKLNSAIELKGNRIKFSEITGTRMTCNNMKTAKIFSQLLSNKLVDYYLENDKLVLYLEDDSKITFKRKEF